jgi:hypothetical protein
MLLGNQHYKLSIAADQIVQTPALWDEVPEVARKLEALCAPAKSEHIVATLAPMAALYGVADRSVAEWSTFQAIRDGVEDYVGRIDSEFFPKPGPLKGICEEHARESRRALGRCREAMRLIGAEQRRQASLSGERVTGSEFNLLIRELTSKAQLP